MNERIQELVKEAGTDCSGKWMGMNHTEKFAQLLIQNCIQTLRNNGYDDAAQCLQDINFGLDHPV